MKWTVEEAKKLAKQVGLDITITEGNLEDSAKKIRKKLRASGTSIRVIAPKIEGRGPVHYGEPYEEEEEEPTKQRGPAWEHEDIPFEIMTDQPGLFKKKFTEGISPEERKKARRAERRAAKKATGETPALNPLTPTKLLEPSGESESRYLEMTAGANKYYALLRVGKTLYTRYGRIDSEGISNQVDLESSDLAHKEFNRTFSSKMRKGYRDARIPPGFTIAGMKLSGGAITSPAAPIASKKAGFPKVVVSPMLAKDIDDPERFFDDPNYVAQQKFDGTRCMIIKEKEDPTIYMIGRSWKSNYAKDYPKIVKEAESIPHESFILDSELTFFKDGKDVFLTALATHERKEGLEEAAMVFDILELDGENLRDLPYNKRLANVLICIPHEKTDPEISKLPHIKIARTISKDKKGYFDLMIKNGGEGVILKKLSSTYQEGARNRDWIKVKGWKSDEAVIVGVTEGTGVRIGTFGSLLIAKHKGKELQYCGKTSGFTNDEQQDLINRMKPLITTIPQVNLPRGIDVKYWVQPKIVIEVKYQMVTEDGLFRMPSFLRIRDDKEPDED